MCACVCRAVLLSWGAVIRSTLTANRDGEHQPQTRGTQNMTVDEEERKCSFIHSFSTRMCVYVCFQTCHCVYVCVCVCRVSTALSLLCEVTDSFIMARVHRGDSTIQGKERRGQRHGTGQVYCGADPRQLSCWRTGWGLLSPLMSLRFFHQLSIYRPVQHFCTGHHPDTSPENAHIHTHTHILLSQILQEIPER